MANMVMRGESHSTFPLVGEVGAKRREGVFASTKHRPLGTPSPTLPHHRGVHARLRREAPA